MSDTSTIETTSTYNSAAVVTERFGVIVDAALVFVRSGTDDAPSVDVNLNLTVAFKPDADGSVERLGYSLSEQDTFTVFKAAGVLNTEELVLLPVTVSFTDNGNGDISRDINYIWPASALVRVVDVAVEAPVSEE